MTGRTEPRAGAACRSLLVAAAIAALVPTGQAAAQTVIDDFTTGQATISDPPGGATSVPTAGGDILGGRRDLTVELLAGPGPVGAGVTGGALGFAVADTTPDGAGRIDVTWDGDSDPGVLDPTGLGAVDLTAGGAAAFRLALVEAAAGAQLVITVYTDATHYSDVARLLPAIAAPAQVVIGFDELLPGRGAAGPADLAEVGAIALSLASGEGEVVVDAIGTAVPAVAATKVDLLAADGTPITGPVPPGTTVRYRVTVGNDGGTAVAVDLEDVLDGELTLQAGSLRSQPIARGDQYRTAPGTAIDSDAAGVPSLLANDSDADGDAVAAIAGTAASVQGGSAAIGADGHFVYTPPPGFSGVDTFGYTLAAVPGDPGGAVAASASILVENRPPVVAAGGTLSYTENDPATAVDGALSVTDPDGTTLVSASAQITGGYVSGEDVLAFADTATISGSWSAATGTLTLTGSDSVAGYQTALRAVAYENTSDDPDPAARTVTWRVDDGFDLSDPATSTITVTAEDDPPVAVADAAGVLEDSGANVIDVLANDTDVDGGSISIASATDPANGTVVVTGGGTGLTYQPDPNYCNDPPGTDGDTFTYTLSPGGSSTTVSVLVTCVNDPPVAGNDAFDFVGNTELRVDSGTTATPHLPATTGTTLGVLDNDADPVEGDAIAVVGLVGCADLTAPFDCTVAGVGDVVMEANGRFTFLPVAGDGDASEQFQYVLSDGTDAATGTVTLTRSQRVWYVKNDAAAGGLGGSSDPFDTLAEAQTASASNDWIFVRFGDGTTTGQAAGILLKSDQHLVGEHVGLVLPVSLNGGESPTTLFAAVPNNRPLLDDLVAGAPDGVAATDALPAEIAGLSLAGNVNAIDVTTTAAFAGTGTLVIRDNVVRSAGADGVDVNLAGTNPVTLALHDNTVTAGGNGIDVAETGTGSLTVTRFDDNVVSGSTGGSGIVLGPAVFDSDPGGVLDTVDGGTTVIGASGNGVGGAGLALANVQGDLHFTGNLNVFADNGTGLSLAGTGAGFQLRVNSGGAPTGIVEATGGPAVAANAAALDLRLTSLESTNSTSTGVSLTNVTGTFSAESGSSITNAAGADFVISGGTANVTYKGTITDDIGQLVSVSGATAGTKSFEGAITDGADGDGGGISISGNGGATIRFTGGVVLSTGTNPAFSATGGGTVTVTGSANTLATTTGTALNVTSTTIGATGLTFRSISANGAANGIVLSSTGSLGGLTVTGNGGADTGGTILATTGDAVSLASTSNVELSWMRIEDSLGNGIYGSLVNGLELTNVRVIDSADNDAADEAGIHLVNLLGTSAWNAVEVADSLEDNVRILNNGSNTLTQLTITGSTIRDTSTASPGNNGLLIQADGNATMTVDVAGSDFLRNRANGVQVINNGGGTVDVEIGGAGAEFTNNNIGVNIAHNGSGTLRFDVTNGAFVSTLAPPFNVNASPINLNLGGASTAGGLMEGNVVGNTIDNNDSLTGPGIRVTTNGAGTMTVLLQNNTITEVGNRGIEMIARDGSSTLNATVFGNTVNLQSALAADAVHIAAGAISTDTVTVCADLNGDNVGGNRNTVFSAGINGIRVRQRFTGTTFRLEDYAGAATDTTAVQTFLAARNDGGDTYAADFGGTGFGTIAQCPMPTP